MRNFVKTVNTETLCSRRTGQRLKGWIPEYVAVRDENGKINGCTLVLVKKIPILNTAMLYAPRGFVCDTHDSKTVRKIFEQIKLIAEKYHAYTLKTDP